MAIHKNGKKILVGSKNSTVYFFHTTLQSRPLRQLKVHQQQIRKCEFNDHFDLFYTMSDEGKIVV